MKAVIYPLMMPIVIIWISPLAFLGVSGAILKIYSIFLNENPRTNRIASDGTPHSVASHLELCCLP